MSISVSELAKQLSIAPEAVILHAMDLDFEVGEDELIPDEIAIQIKKIEQGDHVKQVEHEIEEEIDREIIENQQKRTAGNKKPIRKKKEEKKEVTSPPIEEIKPIKTEDGTIILPEKIAVRDFSQIIGKPIPIVLVQLKQNGIIANLKYELDYDTAAIIAQELGIKTRKQAIELSGEDLFRADISKLLSEEDPDAQVKRWPIVSVMGHVDHGKTSILDYIRKTNVAEGEAGGITQRIGAYQIELPDKYKITFLDTPGHEAFTLMRARGARATDIAILVVATNEGLKPQTIEAINHAHEAKTPIIVAMTKIDLPGLDIDRIKKELMEYGVTPDDWGGDVPCVPVSAKTGQGIPELLETVKIVAEMQNLKANPNRNAICTIIEASVDPGQGVIATILVNTGTLKQGDAFVIYDQYGKIRTMKNEKGETLKEAPPSTPVRITGIEILPQIGDILQIMKNEKEARKRAEEVQSLSDKDELEKRKKFSLATIKTKLAEGKLNQLKLVVKGDSKGTVEAVVSELEKLKTEHSFIKVIHSGVGEISDSDVMLASSAGGIIVGFNVSCPGRIEKLADKEGIEILRYDVIYHLTEKVQEILLGKETEEDKEEIVGNLKIKAVFATNKKMAVVGGEVISGKIRKLSRFRLWRMEKEEQKGETNEVLVGEGKISSVQIGQKEQNEVNEGGECGVKIEHNGLTFQKDDRIELYVGKK